MNSFYTIHKVFWLKNATFAPLKNIKIANILFFTFNYSLFTSQMTPIKSALVSVFHKEGLDKLVNVLKSQDVLFYSTGGTATYLREMGARVEEVEDLTGYPSILGGRVKTLHPKVHGGILARRGVESDREELARFEIPTIDLVVVDLYPFEKTVASGASDEDIIEKIDIGGIALIRGAAKNFEDVVIISAQKYYGELADMLEKQNCCTTLEQRKYFTKTAFQTSSEYDNAIYQYFAGNKKTALRYGENPHQSAEFQGDLAGLFTQHKGKALSYNNLVDIDGAVRLVAEFEEPCFAIIKHTNPCGCAIADNLLEAWHKALAGDPVSAFGGVLACNKKMDLATAEEVHKLFYEVVIAPEYDAEALALLCKKDRIILTQNKPLTQQYQQKTILDGILFQDTDEKNSSIENFDIKTTRKPTQKEITDILLAEKLVKHLKSNAIAIVKDGQLIGSGAGQTSRIDALQQSVHKAKHFGFDVKGSTLASDAFFPFADSVTFAHSHGIEVIMEPGGSKKDEETITFCEENKMCLVFTGIRHFKH